MKKLSLLFLCFFTADSLASGIASNSATAPCTNNTLETYSGNSNLQADWAPNTINLRWYNDNIQITPTNTVANTCTYDGSLTIPSNEPTRTGYTFAGWEVVPEYDFSTLPISTAPIQGYGKKSSECYIPWDDVPCDDDFADLNNNEWKHVYSWGTIYGMVLCSTTESEWGQPGTPDESGNGRYCWCKATGYKPNNSNVLYKPLNSMPWVFSQDYGSYSRCSRCPFSCGATRGFFRQILGH